MIRAAAAALVLALAAAPAAGFDLQGHRGARGLAPENTLAAFAQALAVGVTTLETDVVVTRDDVVVVSHDPDLNPALVRGPDGRWLAARGPMIRTLDATELARYDVGRVDPASAYGKPWTAQVPADGERIPTLVAFFAFVAARSATVRFNIETKLTPTSGVNVPDPAMFARLVVDEIRRASAIDRATLQSFDWRTLVEARRIAPALATSCLTAEFPNFDTVKADASGASPWHAGLKPADHGGSIPRLVRAAGCAVWSPNFASLTADRLADARAQGLRVIPWTVNQPADIERVIDLGVDGLITDYPDRARAILARRGIAIQGVD